MHVLGIWDGHDAGAALIEDDKVVFAANEERFTKRKLEVNFPVHSVHAALAYAGIKPDDVQHIAYSTTEFTKTLERLFPSMRESYYQFRRRKMMKPRFENLRHNLKYTLTTVGITPGSAAISGAIVSRELRRLGFRNFKLHTVEHHTAHAATAAFTSQFRKALVVTLDGLGDGLSGSVSVLGSGKLEREIAVRGRDSLGIFFEQVTNIIGMRELEDEGKVMAMADYSYPFDRKENRFRDFFRVEGTVLKARYSPVRQFEMLQRIAWQMPREQFAYMAQQALEVNMQQFVNNVIDRYGVRDVAFAGGLFSNVKANMVLRNSDAVNHWYVFPHMGDGGIALGAALYTSYLLTGKTDYSFSSYLGPKYGDKETEDALAKERPLKYQEESMEEQAKHAAELIAKGNYIFWFHDRMEYGPRALGNRSILAPCDSEEVKDKLNIYVKKREWFQPFAPSMLEEEAGRILEYDTKGADRFMTMAYMVRKEKREATKSVMHVDGSARAQMVGKENQLYRMLISGVKERTGNGIVLNTSFNIHGMPIVMSPDDAVSTMMKTRTKYMFINGYFVTNRMGV